MKSRNLFRKVGHPQKSSEHGFVLVLVLELLSLLLILVVVSTVMARIERHASWNAARIEQARQNALFALNAAVGQLQREAGPDQRVTARADILSGTSGAAFNQPYWTGVWKTSNPALPNAPLDSGTTTATFDQGNTSAIRPWSTNFNVVGGTNSAYTVDPANPNMVWLVSNSGTTPLNPATWTPSVGSTGTFARNLGSSGTGSAVAPLVPMVSSAAGATGTIGKYGYWVSDEGIKAKVNLSDPTLNAPATAAGFVQNQLHFMAPQAVPIANPGGSPGLLTVLGTSNQTDIRADPNLGKISTLQSLNFISGITGLSGTAAEPFSADATTYGYGVLSDAAHGGLKTDLSAMFEDNGSASRRSSRHSSPMLSRIMGMSMPPVMENSGNWLIPRMIITINRRRFILERGGNRCIIIITCINLSCHRAATPGRARLVSVGFSIIVTIQPARELLPLKSR